MIVSNPSIEKEIGVGRRWGGGGGGGDLYLYFLQT